MMSASFGRGADKVLSGEHAQPYQSVLGEERQGLQAVGHGFLLPSMLIPEAFGTPVAGSLGLVLSRPLPGLDGKQKPDHAHV
jgi:hypothetical protein